MSKIKRIAFYMVMVLCLLFGMSVSVLADDLGDTGSTDQGNIGGMVTQSKRHLQHQIPILILICIIKCQRVKKMCCII